MRRGQQPAGAHLLVLGSECRLPLQAQRNVLERRVGSHDSISLGLLTHLHEDDALEDLVPRPPVHADLVHGTPLAKVLVQFMHRRPDGEGARVDGSRFDRFDRLHPVSRGLQQWFCSDQETTRDAIDTIWVRETLWFENRETPNLSASFGADVE